MDDMAMWGGDGQALLEQNGRTGRFLARRLGLELKPECLNRTDRGMPFLGFRVFAHRTVLSAGSRRRYRRKMRRAFEALEAGDMDQGEFGRRTAALTAHVVHAASRRFRQGTLERLGRRPGARTA